MTQKNHRHGGKFRGSHTSIIPAAATLADAAAKLDLVNKVSLGYIQAKHRSAGSRKTVKFTVKSGSLLLSVRDNSTSQEIRVYSADCEKVKELLSRAAKKNYITVLR